MTQSFNNKRLYDHICNEAIVAQIQSINTQYGILDKTVPGTEVTWGTIIGNIEDQTDLVNFVNELVEKVIEGDIDIDLSKYALKTDLQTLQAQVDAIKVPTKVSELENDANYLTQHQDISNLATKSELELKADKTQLADYALKADAVTHEELADYPTKEEMDIAVNAKADVTDLDALETKVDEVKAVADKAVPYFDFEYQGQQRKTIQLANYDSISGIGTDGVGYNLAMVSKWDKADFGAAGITMNLNTKDVVTINDDKVIATTEDVENAVGQIDLTPYAVKEQADKDYAHAETLVSGIVTSVFGQYYYNPYNVQVAYNVATKHGTTGDEVEYIEEPAENHNFVIDGATTENAGVMSAADKTKLDSLDLDSLATKDELPVMVNIPIRTNATFKNVQTKETILGWFGCTTDAELKRLILGNRPMFLKYGIQLSGNPYYYKMPVQYIAYETANQIKMVLIGLNTHDDAASKYEILMNLDGTVIENNSNVKMTITPLILQTEYNELEAKYTALEARVTALEQPSA